MHDDHWMWTSQDLGCCLTLGQRQGSQGATQQQECWEYDCIMLVETRGWVLRCWGDEGADVSKNMTKMCSDDEISLASAWTFRRCAQRGNLGQGKVHWWTVHIVVIDSDSSWLLLMWLDFVTQYDPVWVILTHRDSSWLIYFVWTLHLCHDIWIVSE